MARPVVSQSKRVWETAANRRLARTTSRAFAAAFACLLVSSLVVDRSTSALERDGTAAAAAFTSGTISLSDDDEGRSLVNLQEMVPGRPHTICIEVTYDGSVLPIDLTLEAEVEGDLADQLLVTVEGGEGGGFDDCTDFRRDAEVFTGTLRGLGLRPSTVAVFTSDGQSRTFRFQFDLEDDASAMGRSVSADLVWEAAPR
ncbi:MAG: hypothetical protein ACRBK7_16825 [Acidimicrobiales bacterium]